MPSDKRETMAKVCGRGEHVAGGGRDKIKRQASERSGPAVLSLVVRSSIRRKALHTTFSLFIVLPVGGEGPVHQSFQSVHITSISSPPVPCDGLSCAKMAPDVSVGKP